MVSKIKAKAIAASAAVMTLAVPALALAEDPTPSSTLNTAMTTAMASVQSDAITMIVSVIPYALVIMGSILVLKVGKKVFKMFSN